MPESLNTNSPEKRITRQEKDSWVTKRLKSLGFIPARFPKPLKHPIHPDPLSGVDSALIAHLRTQHLGGVDTDDEAGVGLEIEMSRVIMIGSGAALGYSITKALDLSPRLPELFWIAESLLIMSIFFAWAALYLGTFIRRQRVRRKYHIYFGELQERLQAFAKRRPVNAKRFMRGWHPAYELENVPRRWSDILRFFSVIFAVAGLFLLLSVMKAVVNGRPQPTGTHQRHLTPVYSTAYMTSWPTESLNRLLCVGVDDPLDLPLTEPLNKQNTSNANYRAVLTNEPEMMLSVPNTAEQVAEARLIALVPEP